MNSGPMSKLLQQEIDMERARNREEISGRSDRELIDYARKKIVLSNFDTFPTEFYKNTLYGYIRHISATSQETIDFASESKKHYESLKLTVRRLLREGNEIPTAIKDFVLLQELGLGISFKAGRGRTSGIRDALICQCISNIVEYSDRHPTQNEERNKNSTKKVSAISIVADALNGTEVRLGESALKKIWKKRRKN